MGANAQTSVPAFTAGQVLTAQQQTEINTGVPVFADATARDAAFGGTGEKTLAEGQLAYLEDSNIVQYYDGSNWLPLALAANSGLTLVTAGSFSGVASWSVDNVFTSTYRNYRIVVHNDQVTGAGAQIIAAQLRVGGVASTASYYGQRSGYNWSTGVVNADTENNSAAWHILRSNGSGSIDGESAASFDLYSPALAVRTMFNGNALDGAYGAGVNGYHDVATAYDGIQMSTTTGGTNMTGTYRIYGYKD